MSRICEKCGVSIQARFDTCPYCEPPQLTAGHSSSSNHEGAHSVSVPVRRKRTLPKSCLLGSLLFIPVFVIACMLIHFQIANRTRLEERMVEEKWLEEERHVARVEKMVRLMDGYVRNDAPDVVISLTSADGLTATVSVKSAWNTLEDVNKKNYTDTWLMYWKDLGGTHLMITVARDGVKKQ